MKEYALLILLGLEVKHFVADYLLQFRWMIKEKNSLKKAGGYVHAGIHALGTLFVLLWFDISPGLVSLLIAAEFVIHYLLDFAKVQFGGHILSTERPRMFWAINGLDQLFHHLTYIAMTYMLIIQL